MTISPYPVPVDHDAEALDFLASYEVELVNHTHPSLEALFNVTNKKTGAKYVVGAYKDSTWACNCPAYCFQKKDDRKDCKHIKGLKAVSHGCI
jgi:hypothetical protein